MENNSIVQQLQVPNVVKKFIDITRSNSNNEYILSVVDKIENFDNLINKFLNDHIIKDEDIELFYKVLIKHIEIVSYINTKSEDFENYDDVINKAFQFIEKYLDESESEKLNNLSKFSTTEGFKNYFKSLIESLGIDYDEYETFRQERLDSITSEQQKINNEVFALMDFLIELKQRDKKSLKKIYGTFLKQVPNNLTKINKIQRLVSTILAKYFDKYGEDFEFKYVYKYIQEEVKLPEDFVKQGEFARKNYQSPFEVLQKLSTIEEEEENEDSHTS